MLSKDQGGPTLKEMGLTEKEILGDKASKAPEKTTGKPEHANPVFNEHGQVGGDKAHKMPEGTTGKPEHANPVFHESRQTDEERLKEILQSKNTNEMVGRSGKKE